MQLKETKSVSEAVRLGVNFSQPKYAIDAVKAVAQQAKAEGIQTPLSVLVGVNDQIRESTKSNPQLADQAWAAQLALVDYRSSLPSEVSPKANSQRHFEFNGPVIDGGRSIGGIQKLDGSYWINFTFENAQIEYDGGPLSLENVRFINCTFKMRYSRQTDKFAGMLLAQNAVTGLVSSS
jgi:hypothetical protein